MRKTIGMAHMTALVMAAACASLAAPGPLPDRFPRSPGRPYAPNSRGVYAPAKPPRHRKAAALKLRKGIKL